MFHVKRRRHGLHIIHFALSVKALSFRHGSSPTLIRLPQGVRRTRRAAKPLAAAQALGSVFAYVLLRNSPSSTPYKIRKTGKTVEIHGPD